MPQVRRQIEEDDEREAEQALFSRSALYDSFAAIGRARANWASPVLRQGLLRKQNFEQNNTVRARPGRSSGFRAFHC